MTQFNIEVVIDTVCPWCYVGKKKLDQAIRSYEQSRPDSQDTFTVTWMPFYLNPASPKAGVDKTTYYQTKFGLERTTMIFQRLEQVGRDVGVNFKFGGKTGNSRDSHRLIQLGKTKSSAMQTRVVEELYATYFEEEGDITSHEVLRKAGVKAGLDEMEVTEWLASDRGGKEVDEAVDEAQANQVTGVPNFTIQNKYEIGGAQDPGVFVRLFEKIKANEERAKA